MRHGQQQNRKLDIHVFAMGNEVNRNLDDWVNYHGRLFGYDHIHFINHEPSATSLLVSNATKHDVTTFVRVSSNNNNTNNHSSNRSSSSEGAGEWQNEHGKLVFGERTIQFVEHSRMPTAAEALKAKSLAAFERLGVDVSQYDGAFKWKSKALSAVMRQYNDPKNVLIPLDVDEYVVLTHPRGNFTTDKSRILHAFHSLPRNNRLKYKFMDLDAHRCGNFSSSDTAAVANGNGSGNGWDGTDRDRLVMMAMHFKKSDRWRDCYAKTFFLGGNFRETDQGNHFGVLRGGDPSCVNSIDLSAAGKELHKCEHCFHFTHLGLAHFGETALDFQALLAKNMNRLVSYGLQYVNKTTTCLPVGGSRYCQLAVDLDTYGYKEMQRRWEEKSSTYCSETTPSLAFAQVLKY